MKNVADFAPKSPSSCFAEIFIDNPELLKILKKYQEKGAFVRKDGFDPGYIIDRSEREAHRKWFENPSDLEEHYQQWQIRDDPATMIPYKLEIYSDNSLAVSLYDRVKIPFAPDRIEHVADCLLQILAPEEERENLKNRKAFDACVSELATHAEAINAKYRLVYWESIAGDFDWESIADDFYDDGPSEEEGTAWKFSYRLKNGVLVEYKGAGGDIVIPEGVTEIYYDAFENCVNLTSIVIPESLTKIGDSAFSGCESLTSVNIPEGVTIIERDTFACCKSLTSIVIPNSVTKIGDSAFSHCESLTSVVIPNSVTKIWRCTFDSCKSLTSIVIPESVTEIGEHAFAWCENLTSVNIPEGVTIIGRSTFEACKSLTSIVIPESVTEIGECAFYWCKNLTSVIIQEGVTKIGKCAFERCENLSSVTIPASVQKFEANAFLDCPNLVIHAPADSAAYRYAKRKKIPVEVIRDVKPEEK